MVNLKKILLVEDNQSIIKGLKYLLQQYYIVDCAITKKEGLERLSNNYDLIILDITLPDGSGYDLALKTEIPILFLSAKDEEEDIVKGLNLGEDYITKPFKNSELLLRIQKILKRNNSDCIYFNDVSINNDKMSVYESGTEIILTALEFKIVSLLFTNINKVITREKIMQIIWDNHEKFVEDNTLSVYIKRIRQKFKTNYIRTIKGVGYIIDEN